MTPMPGPPERDALTVELFVPCESISTAGERAMPVLEHTFSRVAKPRFPAEQEMALFVELWGAPFGAVRVEARLTGPGGETLAEVAPGPVVLDEEGVGVFALPVGTVPLPTRGVYAVILLHDGRELARRRFRVDFEWSTETRTA